MSTLMPRSSRRGADGNSGATALATHPDVTLLHDTERPVDAFAVFYRRHVPAVIRFAASRGLDADAAADVVSDTFLAALRGRMRFRPDREGARLWLLSIASRRIADRHRRSALDERRQARLQSEAIVLTQIDRESYDRLLEDGGAGLDALADLPEQQREVIRARVLEDRDYGDIAEALGLTEVAARQHMSRGLSALRRKLREKS